MKITRENITEHLIDYQLSIAGKDRTIFLDDDKWRFNTTLTRKQYAEFRKYALFLLQKTFKFNRRKAIDTFDWYWMQFGLRIKG